MIKKTFLALLTGVSMMTYAQDIEDTSASTEVAEESTSEFKPEAGEISIDFTANNLFKVFQNSPVFTMSDPAQGFGGGVRLRYFLAPEYAVRANFVTDFSSSTAFPIASDPLGSSDDGDELNEVDAISGYHKQKYSHFSISLGFEKHFSGTKRLDTYAGGEIMYDNVTINEKLKNITKSGAYSEGYVAEASGAFMGDEEVTIGDSYDIKTAAGSAFGVRFVAGADYYVFPKVYLGAELGLAIMQKWVSDYELKEIIPTSGVEVVKTVSDRGQVFNIAQDVNAQFRVGFRL